MREGTTAPAELGVVIIGRNEGDRLKRCLDSVMAGAGVVYVDSGSTDGSAAWARRRGADVVELDMSTMFTAARARNAGWRRLAEVRPAATFVQFVDGDCEMLPAWMAMASRHLSSHPDLAAVAGRLRERFPERSIYNRLCDMEWNTPVGEARSVGGIAMMRMAALRAVEGFRDDLIAGEEPELCVRLRRAGWKIFRLDADMALHDAAMTHFGQWWKRAMRGGHAYAEGASLHGAPPERHGVAQARRALLWGAALPVATLLLALAVSPWFLAALLLYPLQMLRIALRDGPADPARRWRALFLVLARFPEAQGVLKFHLDRLRRRRPVLIEYK